MQQELGRNEAIGPRYEVVDVQGMGPRERAFRRRLIPRLAFPRERIVLDDADEDESCMTQFSHPELRVRYEPAGFDDTEDVTQKRGGKSKQLHPRRGVATVISNF
jgi:hypothetical protein